MLRWRLLLGIVLIAALGALCWFDLRAAQPATYLLPITLVLSVLASGEIIWMAANRDLKPLAPVIYAGNLLIVASNAVPLVWPHLGGNEPLTRLAWPMLALAWSIIAVFLGEMRRYEKPGGVTVNLALAVFALCYVGVLTSFLVQLRLFGGSALGMVALVSVIAVVKMGDIGAYTVGRLIGRHKLAPTLSPGKTIEGAGGAVVFGCLASWLVFDWLLPAVSPSSPATPVTHWIAYGVVVSIAGMIGDLAESLLKRDLGRKDSSSWLPGFGGVLDILDSLLLAAPVGYTCWLLGLVG